MSKKTSNKMLEAQVKKLQKMSEKIASERVYTKANNGIEELERDLKKELIKKNEAKASSIFINRMTQKFS